MGRAEGHNSKGKSARMQDRGFSGPAGVRKISTDCEPILPPGLTDGSFRNHSAESLAPGYSSRIGMCVVPDLLKASDPVVQISSPINYKESINKPEFSPSSFDDEGSLRTPHFTDTRGAEPDISALLNGYCTDDIGNERPAEAREFVEEPSASQWACTRLRHSARLAPCRRCLGTATRAIVGCFSSASKKIWGIMLWPSSVFQKLLLRYSRKCARSIVTHPHVWCRTAGITGCLFLSLLLTALYVTFFRDPNGAKSFAHSPVYFADKHMAGILKWLQVPSLGGSALLQPQRSPMRRRSEDMLDQFGPERRITSILIVRTDSEPRKNRLNKSSPSSRNLRRKAEGSQLIGSQKEKLPESKGSSSAEVINTHKTQEQWPETSGRDENYRHDRGLLERDILFSVWHFTKGIEAVTYHGYSWRDVCKAVSTDTAIGDVCIGMGIFGVYETALGPLETDEAFMDAFDGISTGGVSLSHFAAAFLPSSLYSPTSVEYYPPAEVHRQCGRAFCKHLDPSNVLDQTGLPAQFSSGGATSFFDFRLKSLDALLFTYEVDSRGLSLHDQLGWERAVAQYVHQLRYLKVCENMNADQLCLGSGGQTHLRSDFVRINERRPHRQFTGDQATQQNPNSDVLADQSFLLVKAVNVADSGGFWLDYSGLETLHLSTPEGGGNDAMAHYVTLVAAAAAQVSVSCVEAAHEAEAAARNHRGIAAVAHEVRLQAATVKEAWKALTTSSLILSKVHSETDEAHSSELSGADPMPGGTPTDTYAVAGGSQLSNEFGIRDPKFLKAAGQTFSESGANASSVVEGVPATLGMSWEPWVHNLTLELDESFSVVSSEAYLLVLTLPLLLLFFVFAMRISGGWAFSVLVGHSKLLILIGVVGLALFSVASGLVTCHMFLRKPVTPLLLLVLHLMLGLAVHLALHTMRCLGDVKYSTQSQQRMMLQEPRQGCRDASVHSSESKHQIVEPTWPASSRSSSRSSSQSSYTSSTSSVSVKRICASEDTSNSFDWSWVETAEQQQFILEDAVTRCISCSLTTGISCICALAITSTFDLPAVDSYCTAAACCVACLLLFHILFFCPLVTRVLLPDLMPVIYCDPTNPQQQAHPVQTSRHKAPCENRYVNASSDQTAQACHRAPRAFETRQFRDPKEITGVHSSGVDRSQKSGSEGAGPCATETDEDLNVRFPSSSNRDSITDATMGVEKPGELAANGGCPDLPEPDEVKALIPHTTDRLSSSLPPFLSNSLDQRCGGPAFGPCRIQTPSAVEAAAAVAAASGRNAERAARSVQLHMDADKQERICELQSAGVSVSQQLRSHLHAMRTSLFGRFLAHKSYRLGTLLIICIAFMKCFGLMLLLEPDFDLLRYLPPSSPLRGFVEAMELQPQWSLGAALPLHIILPTLSVLPLHLEDGRSRVKAFVSDILQMPEATGPLLSWIHDVELHANGTTGENGVIIPPSAPCPSIRSTPWPWQSPSAFALHLRRWRSDGRDTFCSTSTLLTGDTTTQAAAKAPWAHGVIPTLYDDSFIRFSADGRQIQGSRLTLFLRVNPLRNIRDSRGHSRKKDLLERLRTLEEQHFPDREVYTHAEWMEDVYRDDWIMEGLVKQLLHVVVGVSSLVALILSPVAGLLVSFILLLQVAIVGGVISALQIPFDVITLVALFASGALTVEYVCLLLFVHITNTPDFAAAPLPSLQSLASLQPRHGDKRIRTLGGVLAATGPGLCCADMPWPFIAQDVADNRSRCRSCGELLSTCFSCRSVTTATLQLLLAAIHRQRHQAPLLAYMSAKHAVPSILLSAASTIVGVCLLMFAKSDSFRIFCLANMLVIGAAVVTTCCSAPLILIYIQPLLPKPKTQRSRYLRSASRIPQNNANYSC